MTDPPAPRHENEIVDQDGDVTMHDAVFERKSAIKRHPAAYKKHVRFELEDPDVAMQDVNDTDVDTISWDTEDVNVDVVVQAVWNIVEETVQI